MGRSGAGGKMKLAACSRGRLAHAWRDGGEGRGRLLAGSARVGVRRVVAHAAGAAVRRRRCRMCSRRATARCCGARIAADGQWRFPARRAVPEKFRRALIVFEDKRFENHLGVDGLAMARAMKLNVHAGRVVSGGSTITMQLARLARRAREGRTLGARSRARPLLALRLEAALRQGRDPRRCTPRTRPSAATSSGSKPRRGATSAASRRALSWAEAATLAVLPNNPSLVHLRAIASGCRRSATSLLRELHAAGDLTALDLELALSEPLTAAPHDLPESRAASARDAARAVSRAQHRLRHHARRAPAGRAPRSSCTNTSAHARAAAGEQRRRADRRQHDVRSAGLRRQWGSPHLPGNGG